MHELVAAPTQTERIVIATKIIKLMIKSVKEFNYAIASICCSVLTCTEGVPPPLEYQEDEPGMRKLIPVRIYFLQDSRSLLTIAIQVPSHMPLTGITSRAPAMRELVWSKLTGDEGLLAFLNTRRRFNMYKPSVRSFYSHIAKQRLIQFIR